MPPVSLRCSRCEDSSTFIMIAPVSSASTSRDLSCTAILQQALITRHHDKPSVKMEPRFARRRDAASLPAAALDTGDTNEATGLERGRLSHVFVLGRRLHVAASLQGLVATQHPQSPHPHQTPPSTWLLRHGLFVVVVQYSHGRSPRTPSSCDRPCASWARPPPRCRCSRSWRPWPWSRPCRARPC